MQNDIATEHRVPGNDQGSQGQAPRLSRQALSSLPKHVRVPAYDPKDVVPGILHLGAGNFALAHLGSYIDQVLQHDRNWGIIAASLRSDGIVSALRKQDGLYVLIEREGETRTASVLAPIVETLYGPEDPSKIVAAIADPRIKMVTLTVSNKGYYLVHGNVLDRQNHDIVHDMGEPQTPRTIYWYLLRGIAERMKTGNPLTIVSLDNVEENGRALKAGLRQFALECQPDLDEWIEKFVDCPVTLVDRITPQVDDEFRSEAREHLGFETSVVVGTERFRQLVVERSKFRVPPWDSVGVQTVQGYGCSEYWERKFFCLNAGHQIVGIPAQRLGVTHVHQAMRHASIARLLERAHTEFSTFLGGDAADVLSYASAIRGRLADSSLNDTVQRDRKSVV